MASLRVVLRCIAGSGIVSLLQLTARCNMRFGSEVLHCVCDFFCRMTVPATDSGNGHACYAPGVHDFLKFSDAGGWATTHETGHCFSDSVNSRSATVNVSHPEWSNCLIGSGTCYSSNCAGICASDSVFN